ncbi:MULTISPECIES: STAS domain-containing protein [Leptospira]|uniref:Anti-sigma factor antagonist n=2 Tax=Leptospira TaxID=171 RepID=A0AAW5V9I5_9LEPT|nr:MULTISPECIES: STAS domain-containing protein [Leptospira]MBL0954420.1 STAS domain-containing protein [Leptospira sp.]MCW7465385.1 STAS domain-containing protein [Leptospira levettii]MCW7505645.1 STAS domain-containing protein [Leptospira paudalimensis]MCW7510125.1 STAS domain-containing protein [Leptospira levettii]MCW7513876.1 STAS domain-containing protein [Leptospira levettii]
MAKFTFPSLIIETESIQIKGEVVQVVSFVGQITNTNAYEINRSISSVFEDGIYQIILDLSQLEYINSIGVATLISIIKTVETQNGKIRIGGLNHFLENVIQLMDLPKKVQIYNTKKEAILNWM